MISALRAALTGVVFYTRVRTVARTSLPVALFAVLMLSVLMVGVWAKPGTATAVTASTLNFQARLQSSVGSVAPDGDYNIQFKLYSAPSGGSALWTENYLVSSDDGVTTRNGYLSTQLGSLTPFPSSIDWGQQLYLTMNIGGTESAVEWDGEMNPRLSLTSVPSAFSINSYNGTTGFTGSLKVGQVTGGNQTFVVPDQGAAGSYTLLTTQAASTGFIQNTTGVQSGANFNISGNGSLGGTLTVGGVTTLNGELAVTAGATLSNASGTALTVNGVSGQRLATFMAHNGAQVWIDDEANLMLHGTVNGLDISSSAIESDNTLSVNSGGSLYLQASNGQGLYLGSGANGSGYYGSVSINNGISNGSTYIGNTNDTSGVYLSAGSNGVNIDGSSEFTGQTNTFSSNATTQNALEVTANNLTSGTGLKVSTASGAITGGSLLEVTQNSTYADAFSSSNKLLNVTRNIVGPEAPGSITLDNTTALYDSQLPAAFTVSGTDRALIVTIRMNASGEQPSAVTYTVGGSPQSLTKLGEATDIYDNKISQWFLINPAAGAGTISAPGGEGLYITVTSWNGVDQADPRGTTVTKRYSSGWGTPGTSKSVNVSTTAGQLVVDGIALGDAQSSPLVPDAGQTLDVSWPNHYLFASKKVATTTSTIMGWSWGSSAYGSMIATPLNPSTVIGGTVDGSITGSVANIASSCLGCTETGSVLNLQQANTFATGPVLSLQNAGLGADIQLSSGILRNETDSTTALRIQNSAGTNTLFTADTTNNRIKVGDSSGGATSLVLDTAASDPAGTDGAMYYNTSTDVFRCYAAGVWADCASITSGGASTTVASGSGTENKITKFNGSGQLADSNLSESDTTLTYGGNAVVNAGSGFTGNLLDIQIDGDSKLSVDQDGAATLSGPLTIQAPAGVVSSLVVKDSNGYTVLDVQADAGNFFFGLQSGSSITTGTNNVALGYQAMQGLDAGNANVALGYAAMQNSSGAYGNVALGTQALSSGYGGSNNVALGESTLFKNSGSYNIALGAFSMYENTYGEGNVALGKSALRYGSNGNYNVALGGGSLENAEADYNVGLGYQAGYSNINGSKNVFIGYQAGYSETGSDKLYIANGSSNPLIYGDFANATLEVTGTLTVTENLTVQSGIYTGAGAGTLRVAADGTLNNVKLGTSQGVAITDGSGNLTTLSTAGATDNCLGYNGTSFVWTTCSGGGGETGGLTAASSTPGKFAKFSGTDEVADSNLSESSTTLTYAGNAVINAASGFTGNLLDVQLDGSSRLSVNQAGNTTIGGTLSVAGNTKISGTSGTVGASSYTLSVQNNASATWIEILNSGGSGKGAFFGMSSNNFEQWNYQGGDILFYTGATASTGTERMRITSAGGVVMPGSLTYGGASAGVLVANTSGVVSKLTGTTGQCLVSQGAGTAPIFDTCGGGGGGGGLSGTGNTGKIAKFSGSTALADSGLSESGTELTYAGNAVVNAGSGFSGNLLDLKLNGTTVFAVNQAGAVRTSSVASTGALTLQSATGSNAITLDSGSTGGVNVGTGAFAKIVTIGNTTSTSSLVLQAGSTGISLTGNTTITGTLNVTGTLSSSGTVRMNANGRLLNVKFGTAATALYTDSSGNIAGLSVSGASGKCLGYDGSAFVWSTCSGGGGGSGWSLTGTDAAGSILGSNVTTSANFVISSRPNNVGATSTGASYISFQGDQYSNANRILISGNANSNSAQGGGAWSSSNTKDYFRIQDSSGNVAFAVQGSSAQQQVFINLMAGSSVGVQGRVCSTLAAGGSGMATIATCTNSGTDLAEAFNSTQELEPGEIVAVDHDNYPNVVRSTVAGQGDIIGIVSTDPNETMGTESFPDGYPIALNGRVPVKINGEGGAIQPGDKITSSSVAGVGKKADGAGMIIGVALTAFDGNGQGTIQVFVSPGYYEPTSTDTLQAQTGNFGDLNVSGTATINNLVVTGLAQVHDLQINGHFITAGNAPQVQIMNSMGESAMATINGNDISGTITINTGTQGTEEDGTILASGAALTITFDTPYTTIPRVMITADDGTSVAVEVFPTARTQDGFTVSLNKLPAANTTYSFTYFVMQ